MKVACSDKTLDISTSIGLLILRVGLSAYMMSHGWGKVQMIMNGQYEMFGDPIGLGNHLSLILAAGAEFVCPLLVLVGLLTRLSALPVVFTMIVAAFVVHANDPWSMGKAAELFMSGQSESWGSKEPALLFAIPFLALVFTGPGKLSIDAILWKRCTKSRPST